MPPKKFIITNQLPESEPPQTRKSGRLAIKPQRREPRLKTDPTRSRYFEATGSADRDNVEETTDSEVSYEGKSDDESGVESDDQEYSQAHVGAKRKTKPLITPKRSIHRKRSKISSPEKTEILLPTGEVLIPYKRPKGNPEEFSDNTIHPSTLEFLQELSENNNREWFRENEYLYRAAKKDFETFVQELGSRIISDVDDTIPELPLKDLVFRIFRDIRFSHDSTPYKVYFSVAWSRTGKKGPYAHYYLHIQPGGKSIIGGGIWHADAGALSLIRQHICEDPEKFKGILTDPRIVKNFLSLKGGVTTAKAVSAFTAHNSKDALKTAPKGYPKDHPEIQLLRLRSFTVGQRLDDDIITSENVLDRLVQIMANIEPLITFLNSIVRPDNNLEMHNGSGSGDDDE